MAPDTDSLEGTAHSWSHGATRRPTMPALNYQPCLHWYLQDVYWNQNMWRNVVFSNESKFCLHQLDLRIKVWKRFGQCYENSVLIAGGGSVIAWCSISLTGKNSACHHWRPFQCREISRWDSATSGSPISPKTRPNSSLKKTILTPTEWVLSTFGEGKGCNGLAAV